MQGGDDLCSTDLAGFDIVIAIPGEITGSREAQPCHQEWNTVL